MHTLNGGEQATLWAGLKAWVECLDGLTIGITESERINMAYLASGIMATSGTLQSNQINQILAATKKVLWFSYSSPGAS
jgi:hypothetical protein